MLLLHFYILTFASGIGVGHAGCAECSCFLAPTVQSFLSFFFFLGERQDSRCVREVQVLQVS